MSLLTHHHVTPITYTMNNKDFAKPHVIDDPMVAFPASVSHLMPAYEDIPEEFKRFRGTFWNKWQAEWFYNGLETFPKAKDGIDQEVAMRHLTAIQRSWEPKHEHKEAAVAYLASLWLETPRGAQRPKEEA